MQNIFVVDTDIERRNSLYGIISQLNCKVTTLPALKELLDALKKERPTCIIVEITSNSGVVISILKRMQEITQKAKIIALVSDDIEQDIKNVLGSSEKVVYLKRDAEAMDMAPMVMEVLKEKEKIREEDKVTFTGGVLIVDDDRDVALMIQEYLSERGYRADIALNGEEALFVIRADMPKVVILDTVMPGMDGLLVLKHIREINDAIEVIMISDANNVELIEEAFDLGSTIYLIKPLGLEKLESTVAMSMIKPST